MLLKSVRFLVGFALILSATGFLIQGGLSRYASFGIPPRPNWALIAIGLLFVTVGGAIIHPRLWRARLRK